MYDAPMQRGGLLHDTGDADLMKQGYRQSAIRVDRKAEGWIQAVERRGYRINQQRLYAHIYHP
ncbi:MAG: hypothetical protein ABIG45_03760 [Bacillota bacterium]